jgi:hypothetical protein
MTADNPANRAETGKFKKGVSGNPNGRPKTPQEFKEIVKANTVLAVNTLLQIMSNPKAKDSDKIKAAEVIIDRAYGKAAQPIVGDSEHDAIQVEATQYTKMIVDRARKLM